MMNKAAKPRLNQMSLQKMAERQRTDINASAYRSRLLGLFRNLLDDFIYTLETHSCSDAELLEIEKDLEAVEAALVHLWISVPYNNVLFTPRHLPNEQVFRLDTLLKQTKKKKNHLKLAHSKAA